MSPEHQRQFDQLIAETFAVIARARVLIEEGFAPEDALEVACRENRERREREGWTW